MPHNGFMTIKMPLRGRTVALHKQIDKRKFTHIKRNKVPGSAGDLCYIQRFCSCCFSYCRVYRW